MLFYFLKASLGVVSLRCVLRSLTSWFLVITDYPIINLICSPVLPLTSNRKDNEMNVFTCFILGKLSNLLKPKVTLLLFLFSASNKPLITRLKVFKGYFIKILKKWSDDSRRNASLVFKTRKIVSRIS